MALTAGTMESELSLIEQAGMVDVIAKPIDIKVMKSALQKVKNKSYA